MLDDSLMAEMFGVIMKGVTDGGQQNINKFYEENDILPEPAETLEKVDHILTFFIKNLADDIRGTPALNSAHFLMLFAGLAHALYGIPIGHMERLPDRDPSQLSDLGMARNNLIKLASIIDSTKPVSGYDDFWTASKSSTQRISSRSVRFPYFYSAFLPNPLKPL
jgi:hypothetical protein